MDKAVVQYYGKNCVKTLSAITHYSEIKGIQLHEIPLIVTNPFVLDFKGLVYSVNEEGLYRFFDMENFLMRQFYYYIDDLWLFAGHLSRMHIHGWRGWDKESFYAKLEKAKTGKLSITCGPTANFIHEVFRMYGVQSRIVHTLTLDEWNEYDNGHTLLELLDPKTDKWTFYDSDVGCMMIDAGKPLSLGEVCAMYRSGQTPEPFYPAGHTLPDTHTDPGSDKAHICYSLWLERVFAGDHEALHAWNKRIMQVPIIDGYFPYDNESDKNRAYSYANGAYAKIPLPRSEWNKKFYEKDDL